MTPCARRVALTCLAALALGEAGLPAARADGGAAPGAPSSVWVGAADGGYPDEGAGRRPSWRADVGLWWNQHLDMNLSLGRTVGRELSGELDIERFLGVSDLPVSDFADASQNAVFELRLGYQGTTFNVGLWLVPPYRYEGTRTQSRSIELGDRTIESGSLVDTELNFFHFAVDLEWNVLDARYVRFAPQLSLRLVGLSWNFDVYRRGFLGREQAVRIESGDFVSLIPVGAYEALPYPELGATLRVGDHERLEAGLTVAGFYLAYLGFTGAILRVEADVTWWVHEHVGLALGWRSLIYDVSGEGESNFIAFETAIHGLTTGLTLRF